MSDVVPGVTGEPTVFGWVVQLWSDAAGWVDTQHGRYPSVESGQVAVEQVRAMFPDDQFRLVQRVMVDRVVA